MNFRSVLALLNGSVFLYFVQATIGTVVVAVAFLGSAMAGRPLTERTAVGWVLRGGGIALSTMWFVRMMRDNGITVRFGTAPVPAAA